MKRAQPRDPVADALAALDLVGKIDALQRAFCRSDLLTVDMLREAAWLQTHVDKDRKAALKRLAAALTPLPFTRLPDELQWIRGTAAAPCYVPPADVQRLQDLIGPDVYDTQEEI